MRAPHTDTCCRVTLFIAALIATTTAVVFPLSQKTVQIAPTEISTTAPSPTPPPPAATTEA